MYSIFSNVYNFRVQHKIYVYSIIGLLLYCLKYERAEYCTYILLIHKIYKVGPMTLVSPTNLNCLLNNMYLFYKGGMLHTVFPEIFWLFVVQKLYFFRKISRSNVTNPKSQ